MIQGQCELSECEQLRRIRQSPIECQQCLTVDDPQEGGAWILHSAGTVPRQGHSALAESAATAASGLKCGVTVCLGCAGLGSTAGNLEWGLFLIPWGLCSDAGVL